MSGKKRERESEHAAKMKKKTLFDEKIDIGDSHALRKGVK